MKKGLLALVAVIGISGCGEQPQQPRSLSLDLQQKKDICLSAMPNKIPFTSNNMDDDETQRLNKTLIAQKNTIGYSIFRDSREGRYFYLCDILTTTKDPNKKETRIIVFAGEKNRSGLLYRKEGYDLFLVPNENMLPAKLPYTSNYKRDVPFGITLGNEEGIVKLFNVSNGSKFIGDTFECLYSKIDMEDNQMINNMAESLKKEYNLSDVCSESYRQVEELY